MALKGFGVIQNRVGLIVTDSPKIIPRWILMKLRIPLIADKRMRFNSFSRSILVAFRPNYLEINVLNLIIINTTSARRVPSDGHY